MHTRNGGNIEAIHTRNGGNIEEIHTRNGGNIEEIHTRNGGKYYNYFDPMPPARVHGFVSSHTSKRD